ncbi:scaffold attachment factor B1-like [Musca vetustissima]|uniref:scaffold attachment factor B1-like n=1 Tax=Musca vetustissima TaxID=27455 RepID=UPI002AB766E1|nr:scaffold attachment factor B1-like [Musca vetustissima]
MKFKDLRVEDLKKELNKLELSSTGNKAELQKRLLDEFERRGMNIDTYEFDSKDEVDLSEMGESNGEEVSSVAARSDDFREMLAKMFEENFRRFEENSRKMNEKLENITEVIGRRVETVEVQIKELDKKVQSVDEKFLAHDHRFTNLEKKISELEIKSGPVRAPDNTLKIKPPVFDGSTSFNVFKLQFETVASRNSWNDSDKAVALLLALKGSAADVIQSIPILAAFTGNISAVKHLNLRFLLKPSD